MASKRKAKKQNEHDAKTSGDAPATASSAARHDGATPPAESDATWDGGERDAGPTEDDVPVLEGEPLATDDGAAGAAASGDAAGRDAEAAGTESDPVAELRRERDATRRERDELHDRWLRTVAELDNLRRRSRREVEDARRFAVAELLRRFLDVQDNFERAMASMTDGEGSDGVAGEAAAPDRQLADLRTGVELIFQSFQGILTENGVQRIEARGEPFDPAFHEAVGHREVDGAESGTVVEVLQEGYVLGDLVLRPSRVIVAP
jgi:molecular chaperone GrpE